jgi:porin
MSPYGFLVDSQYNPTGLRITGIPGAEPLAIDEAGYHVLAAPNTPALWIRGGIIYNSSDYFNYRLNRYTSGNQAYYLAATSQLTQPDSHDPSRGLYVDLKLDDASPDQNVFRADVNPSIFMIGPFSWRPDDMVVLGYIHQWTSPQARQYTLQQQGLQSIKNSSTTSISYAYHLLRGIYWTNALAYTTQPVFAPSHPSALLFTTAFVFSF